MKLTDFPNIQQNCLLKGYSTFGVGGLADYFCILKDLHELPEMLSAAHEEGVPVFILGGGSNVLFGEDGFRGLVIKIEAANVSNEEERMIADAGAKWPILLDYAEKANLMGLEEMAGLPGTIGGAVAGNAGCFGKEMSDVFESAQIYDLQKMAIADVGPEYFQFKYRWSHIKETHAVILKVTLKLKRIKSPADQAFSASKKKEIQSQRLQKQPPGCTTGSFFKNPSPEQPAGLLIDQCGLKGLQIGDAQISPKHANFFMNLGKATAADILSLRDRAKEAVREQFGVELVEEVVILGPVRALENPSDP